MTQNNRRTAAQAIRVLVADDHCIVRDGVVRLLSDALNVAQVESASDSEDALRKLRAESWDALVLDLSLPGCGGLEVFDRARAAQPGLPIIIFTMHPENLYAVRLMRAGACAYVNKSSAPQELVEAVRLAVRGRRYLTPKLGELLLAAHAERDQAHDKLTGREYQLFMLLLEGQPPTVIARQLTVSASTVSTHIRRIKDKLGVTSLAEVVRYGYQLGLINS